MPLLIESLAKFSTKRSYADSRTLARVSLRTPRNPLAPRLRRRSRRERPTICGGAVGIRALPLSAVAGRPPYRVEKPAAHNDRYIISISCLPSPGRPSGKGHNSPCDFAGIIALSAHILNSKFTPVCGPRWDVQGVPKGKVVFESCSGCFP